MLGNLHVPPNGIAVRVMNVVRPVGGVGIRARAQAWEERELKVIVRVDQSWQNLKATQVQIAAIHLHLRNQHPTKIAGPRHASSNRWSWPACAKISLSGGPREGSNMLDRSISGDARSEISYEWSAT